MIYFKLPNTRNGTNVINHLLLHKRKGGHTNVKGSEKSVPLGYDYRD